MKIRKTPSKSVNRSTNYGGKMKNFKFVALNSSGRKEIGVVRAWRLAEAKRKVQQKGFYLVSIRIKEGSVSRTGKGLSFFEELKNIFLPKTRVINL